MPGCQAGYQQIPFCTGTADSITSEYPNNYLRAFMQRDLCFQSFSTYGSHMGLRTILFYHTAPYGIQFTLCTGMLCLKF